MVKDEKFSKKEHMLGGVLQQSIGNFVGPFSFPKVAVIWPPYW